MSTKDSTQGVSNCYVFKSQLQEYAQKVGFSTPVYDTMKEGPSHEPFFRSTVVVNGARYDSLPGFFNRKAAEQSAAEVALMELAHSDDKNENISHPVHETGLCKNLLQEYAQKMNYAIPSYICRKEERAHRVAHYSCTVDIGGLKYIGAAARTKKEAEIKAARTALLAIESSASSLNEKIAYNTRYTVLPCKRKSPDVGINHQETAKALKPKKGCFNKRRTKKRRVSAKVDQKASEGQAAVSGLLATKETINSQDATSKFDGKEREVSASEGTLFSNDNGDSKVDQKASEGQAAVSGLLATKETINSQDETSKFDGKEREVSASEGTLFSNDNGASKLDQLRALNADQTDLHSPNIGVTLIFSGDGLNASVGEVNKVSAVEQVVPMVNNFTTCQGECQGEVASAVDGLKQMGYNENADSKQGSTA